MSQKIHRSRFDRVLAGVAGGVAKHFNLDPILIRVIFLVMALVGGGGLVAYIILWVLLPEEPLNTSFSEGDTTDMNENNSTPSVSSQSGSIIAGAILILLGSLFLADELLPDFDFSKYWPLLLIGVGAALLFTATKKQKHES